MRFEVAIIGAGSYGSALANIIAGNNYKINLWVRDKHQLEEINIKHTNIKYANDKMLNPNIKASLDLEECIINSKLIFLVIPSKVFDLISQKVVDIIGKK